MSLIGAIGDGAPMSDHLRARLEALGVAEESIAAAEAEGRLPLLAIDTILLAGDARYTGREIAEKVGVEHEVAQRLWRALGFTGAADDDRLFTESDLDALSTVTRLVQQGIVSLEVAVQMTRVIGSSVARIADTQVASFQGRLEGAFDDGLLTEEQVAETIVTVFEYVLPDWSDLLIYTHRRHLQAAIKRAAFRLERAEGASDLTIGFADLVGFTAFSQQADEHELATVVDRFEALAYDTVAGLGGRVVKMIGDEVMFVADAPGDAAVIGLTLADAYAHDETLPDVRVGLAHGPVLGREGDYFGATVNLASRIVNIAYVGSVVVSPELHDALADDPRFGWKSLRPRRLKGIGAVPLWVLARSGDDGEGNGGPRAVLERARSRRRRRRAAGTDTAAEE